MPLLRQLTLQLDWTENRPSVSKKQALTLKTQRSRFIFNETPAAAGDDCGRVSISLFLCTFPSIASKQDHMAATTTTKTCGPMRPKYFLVSLVKNIKTYVSLTTDPTSSCQVVRCYGNYLFGFQFKTSATSAFYCGHVVLLC